MNQTETIDFDLLVDVDTAPEAWANEIRKSKNLCRAVLDIADLREQAWKQGIPISSGVAGLQTGFVHYALEPAVAKALHDGETDILALSQARTLALASYVAGKRKSFKPANMFQLKDPPETAARQASQQSRKRSGKPTMAGADIYQAIHDIVEGQGEDPEFDYDPDEARRLTADTGVDYGMVAAGDCAYFVWRAEVAKTRHLLRVVETMERDIARIEKHDSGIEVVDGPRLMNRLSLILEGEDNLRAIEAGLLDAEEFLSAQCLLTLKYIATRDPDALGELQALITDLAEAEKSEKAGGFSEKTR